jgi:hypothetical protein
MSGTLRQLCFLQLEGKENDAVAKIASNTCAKGLDSDSISSNWSQHSQAQYPPS